MRNTSLFFSMLFLSTQISMASTPSNSQAKSCAEQPKTGLKRRIVSKAHCAALQQALFAQPAAHSNGAAGADASLAAAQASDELAKAIAENIELRKQLAEKEKERQHYLVWTELGLLLLCQNDMENKIQATCPKVHFTAKSKEEWLALLKKVQIESTNAKWCKNPAAYIKDNIDQKD